MNTPKCILSQFCIYVMINPKFLVLNCSYSQLIYSPLQGFEPQTAKVRVYEANGIPICHIASASVYLFLFTIIFLVIKVTKQLKSNKHESTYKHTLEVMLTIQTGCTNSGWRVLCSQMGVGKCKSCSKDCFNQKLQMYFLHVLKFTQKKVFDQKLKKVELSF